MTTASRPGLLRRAARAMGQAYGVIPVEQRSVWFDETAGWQRNDILTTPESRRAWRTNADLSVIYGAVFAAIRRRVRMQTQLRFALIRKVGTKEVEIAAHPAIDALSRVNESLTARQGIGLIEQHKLTWGKAYWVKRRNGLGVPIEFEIWAPETVKVVPRKDKPWAPEAFRRMLPNGSSETVDPLDVVWFRHLVDPRDPLNGLSPITAIRLGIDTALEAQTFNQRFFDNSTHLGRVFSMKGEGGGSLETKRLEQDLERKFKGSDKAHRAIILPSDVGLVEPTISQKDMEFLAQLQWSVEEVARVFELSPISLGDLRHGSFENAEQSAREDWGTAVDQAENTAAELTEFFLWPDFGREYRFVARADHIQALQGNRLLQAQIDEIYLRTGKRIINELRERDSEEPVPWGDVPIVQNTMGLLDVRSAEDKQASAPAMIPPPQENPPRAFRFRSADLEAGMQAGWERRLNREVEAIIRHLRTGDRRALDAADVNSYDWNWIDRYGIEVIAELAEAYLAVLVEQGFIDTPLLQASDVAARYARQRGAEMLSLGGRENVVAYTRERVGVLVAETIEQGQSLQALAANLRADFGFSADRALVIARTETADAIGKGSLQAFQSQGFEGKRWVTAGDSLVCPICASNSGAVRRLHESFPSGHDAPPPHPRCRCKIEPVAELPR